jgi:hypothetical protein
VEKTSETGTGRAKRLEADWKPVSRVQSESEYQRLLKESNSTAAKTPTRHDVNDAAENQKRGQKAAIGRN